MISKMKRIYRFVIVLFLMICLVYVSDISNLPDKLILFEGEKLNLKTVLGVNIKTAFSSNPNIERIENNKTITVSASAQEKSHTGNLNLEVSFFGLKVKEINVDIIKNTEVVPLGNLIGVKLYTHGVLVVGMSEITGNDMERYKPYEGTGIEEGDIIVKANENLITCTTDLTNTINDSKGQDMYITYLRNRRNKGSKYKANKDK